MRYILRATNGFALLRMFTYTYTQHDTKKVSKWFANHRIYPIETIQFIWNGNATKRQFSHQLFQSTCWNGIKINKLCLYVYVYLWGIDHRYFQYSVDVKVLTLMLFKSLFVVRMLHFHTVNLYTTLLVFSKYYSHLNWHFTHSKHSFWTAYIFNWNVEENGLLNINFRRYILSIKQCNHF